MTGTSQNRTTATSGGALLASAGLLLLASLLGTGQSSVLAELADIALAVGCGVLAFGRRSIVGSSRVPRLALSLLGIGPLVHLLPLQLAPAPVLLGMTVIALVTIATVVTTVSVARTALLHGVARWMPVLLAADAVLTAAMSSVTLGRLPFIYLSWHFELIRPVALLVWGLSIVLHGRAPAIRRQGTAINTAWKHSTDVGGTPTEPTPKVDVRA